VTRVASVVILQEYIPHYRVAFFNALVQKANAKGIAISIGHGRAGGGQAARNDGADTSNSFPIRQREVRVAGRRVVVRNAGAAVWGSDLVILEQARRNIDAYRLFAPWRRGAAIALWGHGRDYTVRSSRLEKFLLRALYLRASWFFGYTKGGVEAVVSGGFPRSATTVVQNSIDTTDLKGRVRAVSDDELRSFRDRLDLSGPTAIFIGALDSSKRLDFLLEAASLIQAKHPQFRLLVSGDGPLRGLVEDAAAVASYVRYIGPLRGQEKATALAACDIIAMPGRVGLVAVDSFAAGIPIVTTSWPWHAPEFEYLTAGVNAEISEDTCAGYAATVVSLLEEPLRLLRLRQGCLDSSEIYTIDSMASNFLRGIEDALKAINEQ
jgi:glycosyltransferase involved in cell wall biosynthesis